MSRKIRILVVDGSGAGRGLTRRVLQEHPDIEVVAAASGAHDAGRRLAAQDVDVVTLDGDMPDMLAALALTLSTRPGTKVVVLSSMTESSASKTIQALRLGAADFVSAPPTRSGERDLEAVGAELTRTVLGLARPRDPNVCRPDHRALTEVAAAVHTAPAPPGGVPARAATRPLVVAIGASTGGPQALNTLLGALPASFDLPILVAQHMPDLFLSMLAQRLAADTGRHVVLGRDGDAVARGTVHLAPGDRHMVVADRAGTHEIRLLHDPPENFCRPAVNPLFRSVARVWGPGVLAVVLTGMGEDGLHGAEQVVAAGGRVLTQDRESSVVWGMPGAVTRAGLSAGCLPLPCLAERITDLCGVPGLSA